MIAPTEHSESKDQQAHQLEVTRQRAYLNYVLLNYPIRSHSELAIASGLSISTLTKIFSEKSDHLLSASTLAKVEKLTDFSYHEVVNSINNNQLEELGKKKILKKKDYTPPKEVLIQKTRTAKSTEQVSQLIRDMIIQCQRGSRYKEQLMEMDVFELHDHAMSIFQRSSKKSLTVDESKWIVELALQQLKQ